MKIFFGVLGAMIAGGIVSALGVEGAAFRAIAAAVGLGCGWLVHGMLEERQERTRIERELEQDRIRYEQETYKDQPPMNGSIGPPDSILPVNAEVEAKLGRLLIFQSEATLFRSCISLFVCLFCWGVALVIPLTEFGQDSDVFPLKLISVGLVFLLAFLFGYLKSVRCYERGVVIRNVRKSQSILFSDIVAIQYLAVHRYTNGIFEGTLCHFEVIPYIEDAIRVRILGSKRDSNRLWHIVEIILRSNPDAKLLGWN